MSTNAAKLARNRSRHYVGRALRRAIVEHCSHKLYVKKLYGRLVLRWEMDRSVGKLQLQKREEGGRNLLGR
jgi:hypothetical protein